MDGLTLWSNMLAPVVSTEETYAQLTLVSTGFVPGDVTPEYAERDDGLSGPAYDELREDQLELLSVATLELRRTLPPLGEVASQHLAAALERTGRWALHHADPARGADGLVRTMLRRCWRAFVARHRVARLWREARDDQQRVLAVTPGAAREEYLLGWQDRVGRLIRAFGWRVPGMLADDLEGELVVALLQALDAGNPETFDHPHPGQEGTFFFLRRQFDRLRRRRRLHDVNARAAFDIFHERTPTPEDVVLLAQSQGEAARVLGEARRRLSRIQRRYLDGCDEDVLVHGYLSQVRVAEVMGVHKSAVNRALRAIVGELRRVAAGGDLAPFTEGGRRVSRRMWRRDMPPAEVAAPSHPPSLLPERTGHARWTPPWLDVGDTVTIAETGEHAEVVGSDHYLVGVIYRVRKADGQLAELPRDALAHRDADEVPF
jgi:hypothetical protein